MNRVRKQRSIRRVVLALFTASVLMAFLLLAAYESIVSSYYRGESGLLTRIFHASPPAARNMRILVRILRSFNDALLQGPDAAVDIDFLKALAHRASPLDIALRVDGDWPFASPPLDPTFAAHLPAFGAPTSDEALPEEENELHAIYQFDFRTSAGLPASFFILRRPGPEGHRPPFSLQLALIAALILLATDSAVGVFFILRLTGPLRRVEAAALSMSRGDLDTPVEGGYQALELARVFEALETMRSRISRLLVRERESEAERRELIANLSHDLRTPLAAIRGYVDGLREGIADTPEKIARYLAVLGQKIHDLDRMIGQIFLLSTLEAREAAPDLKRIDLRAFLRDSVEELRLSLPQDAARIEDVGLEGIPSFVRADPLQLRRVVENIVDNAVRHGGRRPVTVKVSLADRDRRAEIRIEDDGRGIPPDKAAVVFERFYRGDPSRPGGGFGLGLAIAKSIVEANGGSIAVESGPAGREGGGACFLISLPLEEAAS